MVKHPNQEGIPMKHNPGSFALKPEFHVALAVRNALERQVLEVDERAHARRVRAAAQADRAAVKP